MFRRCPLSLLIASLALSCASLPGARERDEREADAAEPVSAAPAVQDRDFGEVLLFVAISGGGTRAASFGYGALEALRDTRIAGGSAAPRLLEEIDTLAGVSGGSFVAAYYGLHGEGIFQDFEARFLRHPVQRELIGRMFHPRYWLRTLSGRQSRSEVAADYYDDQLFGGTALTDLERTGPTISISATDVSTGTPFLFSRDQFGLLCLDREQFRVARAVAASAAVPGLLTPMTLENRAGSCDYVVPPWVDTVLERNDVASRRYQAAKRIDSYRDANQRRYVHLADGGPSDNLGVRAPLDSLIGEGGLFEAIHRRRLPTPKRFAVIIVDAAIEPQRAMDMDPRPPSMLTLLNALMGNSANLFARETVALMRRELEQWGRELPPESGGPMGTYLIDLRFSRIRDPGERAFLNAVPTNFDLEDEMVDRVRAAARTLLSESSEFQRLVDDLSGEPAGH